MLGERPTVLAGQLRQQSHHECLGVAARLDTTEPASDPAQQPAQAGLPSARVYLYAVACGHRLISGCAHNTGSSTVAALFCSSASTPSDQPGHDLRLEH
jgi:hypothetical protein